MLPDYDLYDMPDYEDIAKELRAELFEKNNRLAHTESLLRKIREEFVQYPGLWTMAIVGEIDTLLGE